MKLTFEFNLQFQQDAIKKSLKFSYKHSKMKATILWFIESLKRMMFSIQTLENYLLKKHSFIVAATFVFLLFLPKVFLCQNENNLLPTDTHEISTLLYGTSDELINGMLYLPEHPLAKGNPYYDDRSKINGTIYIKGNTYPKQVIGYNIVDEKVILSAFQKNGAQFEIELNEALIDSMTIGNTFFINSNLKIIPGFRKGFLEIIYKGGFLFIEKHKKTFVSQYSSSSPNGFYTNDQAVFYLVFDTIPIKISSKKSFQKEFELNQKEIKKYMKSVKFKFNKASKQQWVELLYFCDNLVSS